MIPSCGDNTKNNYRRKNKETYPYTELKPEAERQYPPIPRLIDEALWTQVQDVLHGQKEKPVAKQPADIFNGYIQCQCGSTMHLPHGGKHYACTTCTNRIHLKAITSIYEEKLHLFSIQNQWKHLPKSTKRTLIELLTHSIRVDNNRIEITYTFNPA